MSQHAGNFDFNTTMFEGPTSGFIHIPCPRQETCNCGLPLLHSDCIIIAVDGACRGKGQLGAAGAIGVYFGEGNRHNVSEVNREDSTNQRNELRACLRALRVATHIKVQGDSGLEAGLHQVLIKADSDYVIKGMTQWILNWRKNGFRSVKGTSVTNQNLFQEIDTEVDDLNELGVQVFFWHVPRARNKEADALCNAALDAAKGGKRHAT